MRTYEVAFIAAPNTAEDDLSKLNSQIEQIITDRGGKITKVDNWGRRKLAYRIGKFDEGVYTFVYFEGAGKEIAEVERRLRVTDFVIRYLTVRTDEALKRAEKLKSKRKVSLAPRGPDDDFDLDLDLEDEEMMEEI
ncbi:MAG TPA: 30S ribosomal protein S6 [Blastocatellia bacterium]|nr:30S ribosomal protein S6 [Blastocatellia bacterium]